MNDIISPQKIRDFEILSKLGEGAYSIVYKARRASDSMIYALKKVRLEPLKEKERDNALNEVRILASIVDPFIIQYKEAFMDELTLSLCIVMEYASEGDLQHYIKEALSKKHFIPENEIWKCLIHITKGLQTLHSMKILHRDLKSANVFITKENVYKLGDLNVSKIAERGLVYTQTGTPYYASPEVWRDEPYDIKSDIWSLGCVIYEMTALKPPFQGSDMGALFKKVQKGQFDKLPSTYSQDLINIITQCLRVNPIDRPHANEILNMSSVFKHMEDSGGKLIKKNSKINLLKEIDVPKNLIFLKEKLPRPNYDLNLSFEQENLELTKPLRGYSVESKRSEQIRLKIQNPIKNSSIQNEIIKNTNSNITITKNQLKKDLNLNEKALFSPNSDLLNIKKSFSVKGNSQLKLPEIRPSTPKILDQQIFKNSNLLQKNFLGSQIQKLTNNRPNSQGINQNNIISILPKHILNKPRPNSQGETLGLNRINSGLVSPNLNSVRSINVNNSNNSLLQQNINKLIHNNNNNNNNPSGYYKAVIKTRPFSIHTPQKNTEDESVKQSKFCINELIDKKDNVYGKKEGPLLIAQKKDEDFKMNNLGNLTKNYNINNNRALLYERKPNSAPLGHRNYTIKTIEKEDDNTPKLINYVNLYNKQANDQKKLIKK